jgi:peroxiredoxin
MLHAAYDEFSKEDSPPKQFSDLVRFVRTSQNKTLVELSRNQNVLLVFIRQFGCTFCRETVSEMAKLETAIVGKNLTLVFVHMSDPAYGDEFFTKYYDHPVHHISDPGRALYKSLNLRRGTPNQVFGPMTLIRGVYAGLIKGHGVGEVEGDYLQLGGIFVLSEGQIVFEQKAKSASDILHITALPEL